MPDVFEFHNFVLDAVLFILLAVRYFWGPATDMLRMILFFLGAWAVVGDMNLYYDWHVPWFDLLLSERQIFGKGVVIVFLSLDLLKDYWEILRREHIRRLVASTKREVR